MKKHFFLAITLFLLILKPSFADTVKAIKISSKELVAGEKFNLMITFSEPQENISCSLNLDWGDGQKQKLKLGKGGQIPTPFEIPHIYQYAGTMKLEVKGTFFGGCEADMTGNLVVLSLEEKKIREEKLAQKLREEKAKAEAAKAKEEAELIAKKEAEEKERIRKESPEYKKEQAEKELRAKQEKEEWAQAFSNFNPLEKALNPFGGNKEHSVDFKESGGLNTLSNWFGVYVLGYTTQSDSQGNVVLALVNGEPATPIKKMRSIANAMCGFGESDWKKRDNAFDSQQMSGEAKNQKCEASYDNWVNGKGIVSLMIKRLTPLN